MRYIAVLQTHYSLQFRLHSPVLVTLLVASLGTLAALSRPTPAVRATQGAEPAQHRIVPTDPRGLCESGLAPKNSPTAVTPVAAKPSPLDLGPSPLLPVTAFLLRFLP